MWKQEQHSTRISSCVLYQPGPRRQDNTAQERLALHSTDVPTLTRSSVRHHQIDCVSAPNLYQTTKNQTKLSAFSTDRYLIPGAISAFLYNTIGHVHPCSRKHKHHSRRAPRDLNFRHQVDAAASQLSLIHI